MLHVSYSQHMLPGFHKQALSSKHSVSQTPSGFGGHVFVLAVLFSVAGDSVTVSVTVSVVLSGTVVCVTPCVEGAVLTSKYKKPNVYDAGLDGNYACQLQQLV